MSNVKWVIEGNSDILKLGKERLVELVTQCYETFYALILKDVYTISFENKHDDVYGIICKDGTIATIFSEDNCKKGRIEFCGGEKFFYSFQSPTILSIYCKHLNNDAIVYKPNIIDGQEQLSLRIGEKMIDLQIENLLLLITVGKVLYKFVKHNDSKTAIQIKESHLYDILPNLYNIA